MITDYEKIEEVCMLLNKLLLFLREKKETNWSRGISAAAQELRGVDGVINMAGFESARSIYNTMVEGGRGFAEYFVWSDDEDERIEANKGLDDLRSRIWKIFNS